MSCAYAKHVAHLLQILSGFLGLFLIGWSFLRYETEESAIDDVLASWWIRLDDASEELLSRTVRFVRRTGEAVTGWLDRVFGKRLFSFEAASASVCLSLASILLFLVGSLFADDGCFAVVMLPMTLLPSIAVFYMAIEPARRHMRSAMSLGTLLLIALFFPLARLGDNFSQLEMTAVPTGLALGVISDYFVIIVTRRTAAWAADATNVLRPVAAALISATIGLGTLFLPVAYASSLDQQRYTWRVMAFGLAGMSNVFAAILYLALLVLSLMLIVQKLFWPLINRPIYALHRFRVLQQRKALFYCGTLLLAVAFPAAREYLQSVNTIIK